MAYPGVFDAWRASAAGARGRGRSWYCSAPMSIKLTDNSPAAGPPRPSARARDYDHIGSVAVRCPRVRDRFGEGSEQVPFISDFAALHSTRADRRASRC